MYTHKPVWELYLQSPKMENNPNFYQQVRGKTYDSTSVYGDSLDSAGTSHWCTLQEGASNALC